MNYIKDARYIYAGNNGQLLSTGGYPVFINNCDTVRLHDWNDVNVQISVNGCLKWISESDLNYFFVSKS